MLIDSDHPHLSTLRQCALIGLPRSSRYYRVAGENARNVELMRLIDRQYTATPFFGVRHAGDIQQRPWKPVYQRSIYGRVEGRRDSHQHGRRAAGL